MRSTFNLLHHRTGKLLPSRGRPLLTSTIYLSWWFDKEHHFHRLLATLTWGHPTSYLNVKLIKRRLYRRLVRRPMSRRRRRHNRSCHNKDFISKGQRKCQQNKGAPTNKTARAEVRMAIRKTGRDKEEIRSPWHEQYKTVYGAAVTVLFRKDQTKVVLSAIGRGWESELPN